MNCTKDGTILNKQSFILQLFIKYNLIVKGIGLFIVLMIAFKRKHSFFEPVIYRRLLRPLFWLSPNRLISLGEGFLRNLTR